MTTTNTAPLYVQFAQQIRAQIQALGLPAPTSAPTPTGFPENDGYFFVEWGTHLVAPALIVPKSKTRMGALHSHVDLSGLDGHIALPRRNGRVVCHFEPDVSKVRNALARFIGASKAPARAPVRRLTPASGTPVAASQAPIVPLEAMFPGLAADASQQAEPSYSDDAADEALAALEERGLGQPVYGRIE